MLDFWTWHGQCCRATCNFVILWVTSVWLHSLVGGLSDLGRRALAALCYCYGQCCLQLRVVHNKANIWQAHNEGILGRSANVLAGRQELDEQPIKSEEAEQSHEKCGQKKYTTAECQPAKKEEQGYSWKCHNEAGMYLGVVIIFTARHSHKGHNHIFHQSQQ